MKSIYFILISLILFSAPFQGIAEQEISEDCLEKIFFEYLTMDIKWHSDSKSEYPDRVLSLKDETIKCLNKKYDQEYTLRIGKDSYNNFLDLDGKAIGRFVKSLVLFGGATCKEVSTPYGDTPYCYNDIWRCQINHYAGSAQCFKNKKED